MAVVGLRFRLQHGGAVNGQHPALVMVKTQREPRSCHGASGHPVALESIPQPSARLFRDLKGGDSSRPSTVAIPFSRSTVMTEPLRPRRRGRSPYNLHPHAICVGVFARSFSSPRRTSGTIARLPASWVETHSHAARHAVLRMTGSMLGICSGSAVCWATPCATSIQHPEQRPEPILHAWRRPQRCTCP